MGWFSRTFSNSNEARKERASLFLKNGRFNDARLELIDLDELFRGPEEVADDKDDVFACYSDLFGGPDDDADTLSAKLKGNTNFLKG